MELILRGEGRISSLKSIASENEEHTSSDSGAIFFLFVEPVRVPHTEKQRIRKLRIFNQGRYSEGKSEDNVRNEYGVS